MISLTTHTLISTESQVPNPHFSLVHVMLYILSFLGCPIFLTLDFPKTNISLLSTSSLLFIGRHISCSYPYNCPVANCTFKDIFPHSIGFFPSLIGFFLSLVLVVFPLFFMYKLKHIGFNRWFRYKLIYNILYRIFSNN